MSDADRIFGAFMDLSEKIHRADAERSRAAQKLRKKWCACLVREVLEELA